MQGSVQVQAFAIGHATFFQGLLVRVHFSDQIIDSIVQFRVCSGVFLMIGIGESKLIIVACHTDDDQK